MTTTLEQQLEEFARALVDQNNARVIVPANEPSTGFWFGGGNMAQSPDGDLWLVGRYRNFGDSRTGLYAGDRGLKLAIFRSQDNGRTFQEHTSFTKAQLNVGDREVLSIEGSALQINDNNVELFVSTEKTNIGYPPPFEGFLKPGAGVWTIDRLAAPTISNLNDAAIETVLQSDDPEHLHIKDPFLAEVEGATVLMFCSHPFSWSSSNTGYSIREQQETFSSAAFESFPRGTTWDVAMTRGTCVVPAPRVGEAAETRASLLFYDGGECLRNHNEHAAAVKRPRGYSCEELGGVAWLTNGDFGSIKRISKYQPMFVSPHGTGSSRYVDVCETEHGYYATWQQSQPDFSQPLVMNFLSRSDAEAIFR